MDDSGTAEANAALLLQSRGVARRSFDNGGVHVDLACSDDSNNANNSTVGISRRRNSTGVKRLTRTIVILGLFLAVFIALTLTFVILFVLTQLGYQLHSKDARNQSFSISEEGEIGCRNLDCIVSLGQLIQSINRSADPCQDFYSFACGKFIESSPLESSESSRSAWDVNSQTIDKTLEMILSTDRNISEISGATELKSYRFYLSCLDTDTINRRGHEEAASLVRAIGNNDWFLLGKSSKGVFTGTLFDNVSWRIEDNVVNLITKASFTVGIFGLVIHQDQRNVSRNIVTIDAPNLTLGGRQLYMSNGSNSHLMTAYFNYVYKLANHFAEKKQRINNASVWAILNFEKKIAEIVPPAAVYEHVAENYRILTLAELQAECPIIDWRYTFSRILTSLGYEKDILAYELSEVAIFGDYLKKLAGLISGYLATAPGAAMHIQNYLALVGLHAHADDLGDTISQFSTDFENVLSGVSAAGDIEYYDESNEQSEHMVELPDRQDLCRTKTKNLFGLPLSRYFIEKHFNSDARRIATQLVEEIKFGFIDELEDPTVDWMDAVTKQQAKHKADRMVLNIGYPDILTNETEVDNLFSEMYITDDYVDNAFNSYRFSLKKAFEELKKAPDRGKWEMDPIESNAYYTTSANKIVIPAAILQVPFFNQNWIEAINYGAIGSVIGHEITHAFDVAGSQFDASGRIFDWWDASTRSHFTERTACVSDQYNSYEVLNGMHIDGEMTLSENIADNGGLTAAYRAYRKKVGTRAEERPMPGFELTDEQIFFLSFAQVWCQNIRTEQLANDIETDTHSPNKFRVIGALSNSAEFSRAYSCPEGSFMNPRKKCKVW